MYVGILDEPQVWTVHLTVFIVQDPWTGPYKLRVLGLGSSALPNPYMAKESLKGLPSNPACRPHGAIEPISPSIPSMPLINCNGIPSLSIYCHFQYLYCQTLKCEAFVCMHVVGVRTSWPVVHTSTSGEHAWLLLQTSKSTLSSTSGHDHKRPLNSTRLSFSILDCKKFQFIINPTWNWNWSETYLACGIRSVWSWGNQSSVG